MPNSKSAAKRLRQSLVRRDRNRARRTRMRTIIRKLRAAESYDSAKAMLPEVFSVIDKTAKTGVVHKNTANRQKSRLSQLVEKMRPAETAAEA